MAKDYVQAVSWFRKASDQGDANAQFNLGLCYAKGEGVAKDEIEAYAYLSLAGITNADARKNLAILEKKMSRDEIVAGQKRTKELQKRDRGEDGRQVSVADHGVGLTKGSGRTFGGLTQN